MILHGVDALEEVLEPREIVVEQRPEWSAHQACNELERAARPRDDLVAETRGVIAGTGLELIDLAEPDRPGDTLSGEAALVMFCFFVRAS